MARLRLKYEYFFKLELFFYDFLIIIKSKS